jgi:hypothetical protein
MTSSNSLPPTRPVIDATRPHHGLYQRVRDAIATLPLYFRTQTVIEGISAVDIFTLNSALGATIENQVVATLNQMRPTWDPEGFYAQYSFTRQSQTFPDVLLKRNGESAETDVLLGIELKGWYLLAKEAEPSFRFTVTPAACAAHDLIVVVPWALSNVIAGSPMVFSPFIESSRYAAEFRNYHWSHLREAKGETGIKTPSKVSPYPKKSDMIADAPLADAGGNFGRFARTGIMDSYLAQAKQELLAGIRAEHWLGFFKMFQDQRDRGAINVEIEKLRRRLATNAGEPDAKDEAALTILRSLEQLLTE